MDLNQPLLWLGLLGGLVMTANGARGWSTGGRTSLVVGLLVLSLTALAWLLWPDGAGFVAASTWALLVVSPAFVSLAVQRATDRQHLIVASTLARVLAILHPSLGTRLTAIDREVSARTQAGDTQGAEAALARATKLGRVGSIWASMERSRLAGDWHAIVGSFDTSVSETDLDYLPSLIPLYLRALGETAQRTAMLRSFARFERRLEGDWASRQRSVVWLVVLAFAGRRADVDRVLETRLSKLNPDLKRFWCATADLAAGRTEEAKSVFEALRSSNDRVLARSAAKRLDDVLYHAEPLSDLQTDDLTRLLTAVDHETRFALWSGGRPRPIAVIAIVALNLAAFGIELGVGDPTDDATLDALGSVSSAAVVDQHEWWRLGTFLFLHFGVFHLVMNMLVLLLLGPYVEYALGRIRWLVVYFGSGLFGGLVLILLPHFHLVADDPCVGASGCIMGLAGAMIAVVLRGALRERSSFAKTRLRLLGTVLVLQAVFDLLTPQVSFLAHVAGLAFGFAIASVMRHRTSKSAEVSVSGLSARTSST